MEPGTFGGTRVYIYFQGESPSLKRGPTLKALLSKEPGTFEGLCVFQLQELGSTHLNFLRRGALVVRSWRSACSVLCPAGIMSAAADSQLFSQRIVFNSLRTNDTHQVNLFVPSGKTGLPDATQKDTSSRRDPFVPVRLVSTIIFFLLRLNHLDNLSPFSFTPHLLLMKLLINY